MLQLPPRVTLVCWGDRPFVSPLIDVVDRGRPTGLVLVSAEAVRLLHWQAGRVEQPERSLYELEPGQSRDYDAYVGHPGRTPDGAKSGSVSCTANGRVTHSDDGLPAQQQAVGWRPAHWPRVCARPVCRGSAIERRESWRASADDGVASLGQYEVIAHSRMGEALPEQSSQLKGD